jgi:hypothetical protein
MGGRPWSPEDIEALTDLVGELPWHLVVARFAQRRPSRSNQSMIWKAQELGLPRIPEGEFISIGTIKALTGYSYEKVYLWIDSGDLPAVARSDAKNSPRYVSRKSLRSFAKKRPDQFGGMDQAVLTQLFDSELLAKKIVNMNLPKLTKSHQVECIESGRRFPSIAAAARNARVHSKLIWLAVHQGTDVRGRHYRRVDQPLNVQLA